MRIKIKGHDNIHNISLDLKTTTPQQEATILCISILKPKTRCGSDKDLIADESLSRCVSAVNANIWRQVETQSRLETLDALMRMHTAIMTRNRSLTNIHPTTSEIHVSPPGNSTLLLGESTDFLWSFLTGLAVRVGVLLATIVVLRSVYEFLWF